MKHLKNKKIQACLLLLLADLLFFGIVSPRDAASPLLFVGFILLGLSSGIVWYGLLRLSRIMVGLPKRGIRRLTLGLTLTTVVLLALQSIGQLTVRDGFVILVLLGIFWFYSSYYRRKQI